jgi:hypothetical protein
LKKWIIDDLARDFVPSRGFEAAGILCVFQGFQNDGSGQKIRQGAIRHLRKCAHIKRGRGECIRPAWTPILLFSGGLLMIKLPNLD